MSKCDGQEFEAFIARTFAEHQGFTALLLLLSITDEAVVPVSCAYVHVIGSDVAWSDMKTMLNASGQTWQGFAVFAEAAPGGGPLIDVVAKARLQQRIDEVTMNRMALNDAGFFDTRGRAMRIDPIVSN